MIAALGNTVKSVVNARLSHRTNTAVPDRDGNTTTLYLHPWRGSEIALWSVRQNRWVVVGFRGVQSFSLAPCNLPNRVYDVYAYFTGTELNPTLLVEYQAWGSNSTPPNRDDKDGILTKGGDPSRRLIGVVRTDGPGAIRLDIGQTYSVGNSNAYPNLPIANLDNTYTASLRFFFGSSWTTVSNAWMLPPGYGTNARCRFVQAAANPCTAFLDLYYNKGGNSGSGYDDTPISYVAPGINRTNGPPSDAFYGEASLIGDSPICVTVGSQWARSLTQGDNSIYYLYRNMREGSEINEHPAHGMIVTCQV